MISFNSLHPLTHHTLSLSSPYHSLTCHLPHTLSTHLSINISDDESLLDGDALMWWEGGEGGNDEETRREGEDEEVGRTLYLYNTKHLPSYQHTLSTHPISILYQHTLSTHSPYPTILSTHPILHTHPVNSNANISDLRPRINIVITQSDDLHSLVPLLF